MQNLEIVSTEAVMFNEIHEMLKRDGIAKSQISQHLAMLAKAGIHFFSIVAVIPGTGQGTDITGPVSGAGPPVCRIPIANPEYMFSFTTIFFDESVIFQP